MCSCISGGFNPRTLEKNIIYVLNPEHGLDIASPVDFSTHRLEARRLFLQGLTTKIQWDSGHFSQLSSHTMFSYR